MGKRIPPRRNPLPKPAPADVVELTFALLPEHLWPARLARFRNPWGCPCPGCVEARKRPRPQINWLELVRREEGEEDARRPAEPEEAE
jgi:hypothetical protein